MTIYKTPGGEKKTEKEPEVLTEPLTGVKDEVECEEGACTAPKLVRVTYFPQRRGPWVNLCLILTALLVLGTGTIAAIFLYRHLSNKVVHGRCGVTYYDEIYHRQQSLRLSDAPLEIAAPPSTQPVTQVDFMEEDIEVSAVDLYERLTIPKFDEVQETVVWHDFDRNLTAIVDPTHRSCYILPLNRTRISPPRDLIDLIYKLKTGYYMPKASVVREQYRMVQPPMSDLTVLGSYIMRECFWYDTYRLEKYVSGVYKRSVDNPPVLLAHNYGYFSYKVSSNEIVKLTVYGAEKRPEATEAAVTPAP